MKKFYEDPSLGIQTEDVPANNAGSGAVAMPPDAKMGKKKKNLYDGRRKEAKAFFKRMEMLRAKKQENLNLQRKYKRILLNRQVILQKIILMY